jgi:hypothetical protein
VCRQVDNNGGRILYSPSWTRRRLARWRVCEAPHCSHGDRASGHLVMAMFASPRRMCGVWREFLRTILSSARRSRLVPGCLTSESEERETWTAESLRAASSNGRASAFSRRVAVMEETSADNVSRFSTSLGHASDRRCRDLVKRVICRDKVLIQLESLILAQSERWRQA